MVQEVALEYDQERVAALLLEIVIGPSEPLASISTTAGGGGGGTGGGTGGFTAIVTESVLAPGSQRRVNVLAAVRLPVEPLPLPAG